jgi:hypothetical protein
MKLFNKLFSQDAFQLIPRGRLGTRKSRLGGKNPPSPPFAKGGLGDIEKIMLLLLLI